MLQPGVDDARITRSHAQSTRQGITVRLLQGVAIVFQVDATLAAFLSEGKAAELEAKTSQSSDIDSQVDLLKRRVSVLQEVFRSTRQSQFPIEEKESRTINAATINRELLDDP